MTLMGMVRTPPTQHSMTMAFSKPANAPLSAETIVPPKPNSPPREVIPTRDASSKSPASRTRCSQRWHTQKGVNSPFVRLVFQARFVQRRGRVRVSGRRQEKVETRLLLPKSLQLFHGR